MNMRGGFRSEIEAKIRMESYAYFTYAYEPHISSRKGKGMARKRQNRHVIPQKRDSNHVLQDDYT